jgi:hypothetical protein
MRSIIDGLIYGLLIFVGILAAVVVVGVSWWAARSLLFFAVVAVIVFLMKRRAARASARAEAIRTWTEDDEGPPNQCEVRCSNGGPTLIECRRLYPLTNGGIAEAWKGGSR